MPGCLLLFCLLLFCLPARAAITQLPKGWSYPDVTGGLFLGDIGAARMLVGRIDNYLLMNIIPRRNTVISGNHGVTPVLYDLSKKRYAPILKDKPLRWLDPDKELASQLDADEIHQLTYTRSLAFSNEGYVLSGMYGHYSTGYVMSPDYLGALTIDLEQQLQHPDSKTPMQFTILPASDGKTGQHRSVAYKSTPNGELLFGVEYQTPLDISEDAHASPKKYILWQKNKSQQDNSYQAVTVDFSQDKETEQLLKNGNAALFFVSASDDMNTIAVNRITSYQTPIVAGIIQINSAGHTTWNRLPLSRGSQVLSLTRDGGLALVRMGENLYSLPPQAINESFSLDTAFDYLLPGGLENYQLDTMFGNSVAVPILGDHGIQHLYPGDSPFSGMLVNAYGSATGIDKRDKSYGRVRAFPQIGALLALRQNQTAANQSSLLTEAMPVLMASTRQGNKMIYYGLSSASEATGVGDHFLSIELPVQPTLPAFSPHP